MPFAVAYLLSQSKAAYAGVVYNRVRPQCKQAAHEGAVRYIAAGHRAVAQRGKLPLQLKRAFPAFVAGDYKVIFPRQPSCARCTYSAGSAGYKHGFFHASSVIAFSVFRFALYPVGIFIPTAPPLRASCPDLRAEYTAAAKPPFAEKQIVLHNYITYCTRGAMQQRAFCKKYSRANIDINYST
jgi:hypothetical protein